MKKTIILIFLLTQFACYCQCPPYGFAQKGSLAYYLNQKKNRTDTSATYTPIAIDDFLKLPDDSTGDGTSYQLTGGYVIKVKHQGAESCNCASTTNRDYHIVIVPTPEDKGNIAKYVIVEVSARVLVTTNWTDTQITSLKGHYVDFYGYKFADLEHLNNSIKSNPKNLHCWRGTVNEIHPIFKFIIVN